MANWYYNYSRELQAREDTAAVCWGIIAGAALVLSFCAGAYCAYRGHIGLRQELKMRKNPHPAKSQANATNEPVSVVRWGGGRETLEPGDLLLDHPKGIVSRGDDLGLIVEVHYPDPGPRK